MAEIFVVSSGRVQLLLATCQGCTCYLLFCRTIACNFSSKWRQVFISRDFLCHSTAFQAWLRVAPSEEAMTAAEFARTKMHLGHSKVVPQVKQNDIRIWWSRIEFQSPPLKAGACARSSWSFGHVADLAGRVEVTTAFDSYRSEPCWIHLGTVGCVSTFHGRIATWMPFGAGQCCNPKPGERTCKPDWTLVRKLPARGAIRSCQGWTLSPATFTAGGLASGAAKILEYIFGRLPHALFCRYIARRILEAWRTNMAERTGQSGSQAVVIGHSFCHFDGVGEEWLNGWWKVAQLIVCGQVLASQGGQSNHFKLQENGKNTISRMLSQRVVSSKVFIDDCRKLMFNS